MKDRHEGRLSKKTIAVISFFFGVGVLSAGAVLGVALPLGVTFLIDHSEDAVRFGLVLCGVAAVFVVGRPVQNLLSSRDR